MSSYGMKKYPGSEGVSHQNYPIRMMPSSSYRTKCCGSKKRFGAGVYVYELQFCGYTRCFQLVYESRNEEEEKSLDARLCMAFAVGFLSVLSVIQFEGADVRSHKQDGTVQIKHLIYCPKTLESLLFLSIAVP